MTGRGDSETVWSMMLLPKDCPIVIVDDDPSILETVADILDGEGYPVVMATNGREAMNLIERMHAITPDCPPLILLDMRMPVLDGWGVARELRERGFLVPIVVMTAAQDAQRWCDEIGARGCLPKPFELEDLLSEVRRVLEVRQLLPA